MQKLTAESFFHVLNKCHEGRCIKAGILFANCERAREFAYSLEKEVRDGRIPSALYLFDTDYLWFETGSNIQIINVVDYREWRGKRFDVILYDEDISDNVLEQIGFCEKYDLFRFKSAMGKQCQVQEEQIDTSALDEFLGEFQINKNQVLSSSGGDNNG